MKKYYDTVMNAEYNSLRKLPPAQRFQIMAYLSIMWSTIFCFGIGYWALYGHLVLFHVLVALGIAFTGFTFENARRGRHLQQFSKPVAVKAHRE